MRVIAAGVVLLVFFTGAASARLRPSLPPGQQIEIDYKVPSPAYQPIREGLKKYAVLERLANFLSPLRLPADRKLVLLFDECGAEAKPSTRAMALS